MRCHRSLATQPAPTSNAPLVSSHASWQSHRTSGAMYSGLSALAKSSGMTPAESLGRGGRREEEGGKEREREREGESGRGNERGESERFKGNRDKKCQAFALEQHTQHPGPWQEQHTPLAACVGRSTYREPAVGTSVLHVMLYLAPSMLSVLERPSSPSLAAL